MTHHRRLFVWRDGYRSYVEDLNVGGAKKEGGDLIPPCYYGYESRCPFCGSIYEQESLPCDNEIIFQKIRKTCIFCGFRHTFTYSDDMKTRPAGGFASMRRWESELSKLRVIGLNDADLGITELGSHLKGRFSDAYYIHPRRFEELVADVFSNFGYYTHLTQQTRDGGYDILLLERTSGEQVLVECKRYGQGRKVSVSVVREVLGVQLALGAGRAAIVTTSHFTAPARELSERVNQKVSGYELALVDADILLKALRVYNENLPPFSLESCLQGRVEISMPSATAYQANARAETKPRALGSQALLHR